MAGNQRAYASLLHETTRLLRPFLAKRLSIANEVNDLMQEILLSIHKARHAYDGNRPYTSRVSAIVKFRLQDHLRVHSTNCAMPLISTSLKNICLSLYLPVLIIGLGACGRKKCY